MASSSGSSSGSSGATDAQPPQGVNDGGCPYSPPLPATVCAADGVVCGWGGKGPCGESCSCENSAWQCQIQSCPPDVCPVEPSSGAACPQAGLACFYAIVGGCGDEECDCSSSGTWSCVENMCVDAGAPSDGGSDDGGGYCPLYQPPNSAPCSDPGTVCSYYTGCETNCLCASSGWVCAAQQGCVSPPQPDL